MKEALGEDAAAIGAAAVLASGGIGSRKRQGGQAEEDRQEARHKERTRRRAENLIVTDQIRVRFATGVYL